LHVFGYFYAIEVTSNCTVHGTESFLKIYLLLN